MTAWLEHVVYHAMQAATRLQEGHDEHVQHADAQVARQLRAAAGEDPAVAAEEVAVIVVVGILAQVEPLIGDTPRQ